MPRTSPVTAAATRVRDSAALALALLALAACSGAEHGGHDAGTAGAPSAAAEMICAGQVQTAIASLLQLERAVEPVASWDAPDYSCSYDIEGAPLVLTVHDSTDVAVGEEHFAEVQRSLDATAIEGMLALGLPSFSTGDGIVGFLRDGKTLVVDATALPESLAGGALTRDGAAYAVASAVLVCWVEHD
ncbi:hypothetical protein [Agrococcus sp. Marseille-Q4369]|uniref:hypothetical protein n=1 Tax=Agrococcus sp. Marseille-Q4369 TaxID=2810513 RepID=UPI001B8C6983|nr:hypothetical protein [Agrococcus sp. Marseille-Q4369]QUW19781.1 hypothetical protein JSQ78_05720 [Agrococcus sp. Marseille-Q4369]